MERRLWRGIALAGLSSLGCLVAVEGVSSALLAWGHARRDAGFRERAHSRFDAELGWANRPSVVHEDMYGPGIDLTINDQGLRGLLEYGQEKPENSYRIVCLGDSFTLGYGVGDLETYEACLERQVGVQAINMGLGGYGVDQCYLWYLRDGVDFETDLLVFAVIRDDFFRMLTNKFTGYYGKPRLELRDGELAATGVPVPERWQGGLRRYLWNLWQQSSINRVVSKDSPLRPMPPLRPFGAADLPFAPIAEAVFANLRELCLERGQGFAVVYLPDRLDLEAGRSADFMSWLHEMLARIDVALVDLTPDFAQLRPSERNTHFLRNGHYTILGNELVAACLTRELRRLFPDFPR